MSEFTGGYWAIVELMGHVRVAGYVTEEENFGAKMGRIEIPAPDGRNVTQWFGGSSVYRITPTTEEIARRVAIKSSAPVSVWDLPRIEQASSSVVDDPVDYYRRDPLEEEE